MQHLFDDPYLSEEDVDRILKLGPVCPECKKSPVYVHFYVENIHKVWFEVDGSPSTDMTDQDRLLINISSERHDTVDSHPNKYDYPKLECESGHTWVETGYFVDERYYWLKVRKR